MIDGITLTFTETDSAFIATNFDPNHFAVNNERMLVRYEFIEVIARLARVKYLEKNLCETMSQAIEKLITKFILPNFYSPFDHHNWRLEYLYNLDINDMIEANEETIKTLFLRFATIRLP
jgi:hypothetical protein